MTESPIVLQVIQSLRGGGAEALVRELVPRLTHRGMDARVLCAYGESGLTASEEPLWPGKLYVLQRSRVSRFLFLRQMRKLIAQVKPAIVHTHTHVGASWGRAAAVLAGTPIIVHTEHRSVGSLPAFERIALALLRHRTDAVITFSERNAQLVHQREHIRNLRIIPNGVSVRNPPTAAERATARKALGIQSDDIILFGIVANLYPHKNLALALDAFAQVPCDEQASWLGFSGHGPLRAELERKAAELGLSDRVKFYGFRTDLDSILPGLDVVLTTSPREMMPLSLLEAMNASLPIIGTPHLGTLDLVSDKETGIILRGWQASEMAEAMRWCLGHPEWRVVAGRAARERLVKHFDIEKVADQHVDLYRELLRRKRLPA